MTLCININPNHTYKQAVEAAYHKAKREGVVLDKGIEEDCLRVMSEPGTPEGAVYHESDLRQEVTKNTDGSVTISNASSWQSYEYWKILQMKSYTNALARDVDSATEELKEKMVASGSSPKDALFVVDKARGLKAFSPSGKLSSDEIRLLSRLANENSEFKLNAIQYAKALISFVDRTIDGMNGRFARYFSRS
ncbi:hypothetical protein ACCD10_06660 [Pseudomonas sp. Pseusp122]|uniref:hypothetical protein n=1 Tax=unclassified Pseudomonas TaxID=196821 RepID=UPI0039A4C06C